MSTYVPRSAWGARAPNGSRNEISGSPKGSAIHWEGPEMGSPPHSECDDIVRGIQAYHMDSNGWSDVAYNLMVCIHGYVYEGRGKGVGSAANGSSQANHDWYAVCALVGEGDAQPAALIDGLQDAAAMCRDWGAGNGSCGHRDLYSTACPGDALYALVRDGAFQSGGSAPDDTTPPPTPAGVPPFPLPPGHYFGPAEGPAESHSGYYSTTDQRNLMTWQERMSDRGWTIDVDGLYGPQTDQVATQFQQEKGLSVDGLIGAETWQAAWTEPVT
jgi:Putative peptidoglycan binding domain